MKTISLKQNRDFQRLYKRGGKAVSKNLIIYYRKNQEQGHRVGITVSKKVGSAVVRNKVKRRIKECFRKVEGKIPKPHDIVIVARPRCAESEFSDILKDLEKLVIESGLCE